MNACNDGVTVECHVCLFSTSAMSLLYECINTVIAGKSSLFHHFFHHSLSVQHVMTTPESEHEFLHLYCNYL